MILTGEKRSTVEKPVQFPLILSQIPYVLPWVLTRASAGRCRRLNILPASVLPNIVGIIVCDGGSRDIYRKVVSLTEKTQ
jgi:hypothetical protein